MDELSKSCLSLDEAEWDSLPSAKCWQEHKHFNGVNIVSHHDELCLTLFNELGNVVQTELENNWLGGLLSISTTGLGFSFLLKSGLLFLLGLWLVLCK